MQYSAPSRALAGCQLAFVLSACAAPAPAVSYGEASASVDVTPHFALFTVDPVLQESTLRARQRITAAIGETGLTLADANTAAGCRPFQGDCGFELAFAEVVYCRGNPDPALACTAQGGGGKALGIELQASLAGAELENRLIHELFHVITFNRAPHASDGLFMEYSFGGERLSESTLGAVCAHFACSRFVAEEETGQPFAQ
jgi:hypothetical protein